MTILDILDLIGFIVAVKVSTAWLRDQGFNPLRWNHTFKHIIDCSFCSAFWAGLLLCILLGENPAHAFALGAVSFAFWRTFGYEAKKVDEETRQDAPGSTLPVRVSPKVKEKPKQASKPFPTILSPQTSIDDDIASEFTRLGERKAMS